MQVSNLPQIKDLLDQSQSVFVVVGSGSGYDQLVAASALSAGLQAADKAVRLLAVEEPKNNFGISELSQLKTDIGHQHLSISFEYSEDAVDKVSYHIGEETNRFYLTIKPKKGHDPLDPSTVEYSYTGADVDLIFLIGVGSLEDLEQLYYGYEKLYQDTPIVSINTYPTSFGTVKLETNGATGYSDLTAQLLDQLDLYVGSDSATHLLSALEKTSESFQSDKTTAETFEIAASLLRAGAVRTPAPSTREERADLSQKPNSEFLITNNSDSNKNNKSSGQFQPNQTNQSNGSNNNSNNSKKYHKKKQKKDQRRGGLDYQPSESVSRN